ncbi:MAG TPA: 2-phospho-L-lactate transferase CofD family protein, partial [Trueperaceae bacterium]|nr:2-phospho-L-lactate transferase CofD family protein [Trueperaceae bacterium]
DLIVLGPGSLFSSTIPPLLVPSVVAAVNRSPAKLVYVCNIMTEAGETDGFDAYDHVAALQDHGVRAPDIVLWNSSPVDKARLENYRGEAADLVARAKPRFTEAGIIVMELPLLGSGAVAQHDSDKLAAVLADLATGYARQPRPRRTLHLEPGASA